MRIILSHSKLTKDYSNLVIITDHDKASIVDSIDGRIVAAFTLRADDLYHIDDIRMLHDSKLLSLESDNHTFNLLALKATATTPTVSKDFIRGGARIKRRATTAELNKLELLHVRLGHMSEDMIKYSVKHQLHKGLGVQYNEIKGLTLKQCDACMKGKMRAFTIPPVISRTEYGLFEYVSLDILEYSITSVRNFKYQAFYVDKCSTFLAIYHMKTKDELLLTLKTFLREHSQTKNPRLLKVRYLQPDSGKEALSASFLEYCQLSDIQLLPGAPYKHQQVLAESHVNGHKGGIRTVMKYNQAPPSYWCYAADYHVHNWNRMPRAGRLITRYEHVYGVKPDLSYTVPFYAKGFFHVTPAERQQLAGGKALADRAKECRMLGYPITPDIAYRNCYTIITTGTRSRSILIRHDCSFRHYTDKVTSLLNPDEEERDIIRQSSDRIDYGLALFNEPEYEDDTLSDNDDASVSSNISIDEIIIEDPSEISNAIEQQECFDATILDTSPSSSLFVPSEISPELEDLTSSMDEEIDDSQLDRPEVDRLIDEFDIPDQVLNADERIIRSILIQPQSSSASARYKKPKSRKHVTFASSELTNSETELDKPVLQLSNKLIRTFKTIHPNEQQRQDRKLLHRNAAPSGPVNTWRDSRNKGYAFMTYQLDREVIDPDDPNEEFSSSPMDAETIHSYVNEFHDEFNFAESDDMPLPATPPDLKTALAGPDKVHWKRAYDEEMERIRVRDTWEVCDEQTRKDNKNAKAINSRFVLRLTRRVNGTLKYKVRLVAKGFAQVYGRDYLDTFAPTCKYRSFTTLLSLAATNNWAIKGIDVENAYLESTLDQTVYMYLPSEHSKEKIKVKLKKSLYGLKQAGEHWNRLLNSKLLKFGFKRTIHDMCVYVQHDPERNESTYVIVYVDNIIITGSNTANIDYLIEYFSKEFRAITIDQELKRYLGVDVARDYSNNTILLTQKPYTTSISKNASSRTASTPLNPTINYREQGDGSIPPIWDETGKLRYAADKTKPEIQYAASVLAANNLKPHQIHVDGIDHVKRYLRDTADSGVTLGGNDTELKLFGMCDASFIPHSDSRSQLGYAIWLNKTSGAIYSKTKKDTTVSHNSTIAEIKALDLLIRMIIWFRGFFEEIGYPQTSPTKIYMDNQSAIRMSQMYNNNDNTNHIVMRLNFIHQEVENKTISLHYINTYENVADILTKQVPIGLFSPSREKLLHGFKGQSIPETTSKPKRSEVHKASKKVITKLKRR